LKAYQLEARVPVYLMHLKTSSENDPTLRELLGAWTVKTSLPPRFGEQVWNRIERAERPPSPGVWLIFAASLARAFTRPSQVAVYAAILLLAGSLGGYWQARIGNERTAEDMRLRYVQMVDPYQTPRN
jgi:hypothetical protein